MHPTVQLAYPSTPVHALCNPECIGIKKRGPRKEVQKKTALRSMFHNAPKEAALSVQAVQRPRRLGILPPCLAGASNHPRICIVCFTAEVILHCRAILADSNKAILAHATVRSCTCLVGAFTEPVS